MTKKTLRQHLLRRILSFKYALNGLKFIVKTQTNMQIHIFAAFVAVFLGFKYKLSECEWLALILTIGLVIIAETVNTGIEKIVDFISPEFNDKAGLIKDISASFVLLAALIAVIIGIVIFLPKILI